MEEAADAAFTENDGGAVQEAVHAWVGGFAVVDSMSRVVLRGLAVLWLRVILLQRGEGMESQTV